MTKLLKFEFRRLFKSLFFKIISAYCIVWPVIVALLYRLLISISMMDEGLTFADATIADSEIQLFNWMIGVAFVNELPKFIALFVCLHIGRDFSDGVVRNKVIAGHSRAAIFFSYMITQITAVVLWCVVYILFAWLGLAISGIGINLNGGEMIARYAVAIMITLVFVVTFVVISIIFRRRTLPIIFSIIIVTLMSTAANFVGMYNTPSKAVDAYIEKRDAVYEEMIGYNYLTENDVKTLKKYYTKDRYLTTAWKVMHPVYLITTLGFNGDYTANLYTAFESNTTYKTDVDYSAKICRDNFFETDYSGLKPADFKDTEVMHMSYSTLNLIYTAKSLVYILCIGGSGYIIFRKKNLF